jgi:hypothetical protein
VTWRPDFAEAEDHDEDAMRQNDVGSGRAHVRSFFILSFKLSAFWHTLSLIVMARYVYLIYSITLISLNVRHRKKPQQRRDKGPTEAGTR